MARVWQRLPGQRKKRPWNRGAAKKSSRRRSADRSGVSLIFEPLEERRLLSVAPGDFGEIGLSFEANQGQADEQVQFLARGTGYGLFLTSTEAVLALARPAAADDQADDASPADLPGSAPSLALVDPDEAAQPPLDPQLSVLRMQLVGANPQAHVSGLAPLAARSNYFVGNDPAGWRTDVPHFGRVEYQGVYSGVDLVYYGNERELQYDFTVAPGADAGQIVLGFEGAEAIRIDDAGNLVLTVGDGELVERAPVVYQQQADGSREIIDGSYVLRGAGQVGFEIGPYDASRPLVIDPILSYSTYLGGNNTDHGVAMAADAAGHAYITGMTVSSNFPLTPAGAGTPARATFAGNVDVFVTKLAPNGSGIVYSTYLGGSGDDRGHGIALDGSGNAYLTGMTTSANFPTVGTIQSAHGGGTYDAFVTKLNANGSALVYSTYLGGSGSENQFGFHGYNGGAIAVDSAGNALVAGMTSSVNFPTAGAAQTSYGGGSLDAFLTRVNAAGTAFNYSTYLGGSGEDRGAGIAVDGTGKAYVTGFTVSDNFPTTAAALQTSRRGAWDAFVTKIDPSQAAAASLGWSTYLGGFGDEFPQAIAVDATGHAYLTGLVWADRFPTTSALDAIPNGHFDAFVSKLTPDGCDLVYSTYLGGGNDDRAQAIAVDAAGNAHVAGFTASRNFPTVNAVQATHAGGPWDGFVARLNARGTALHYSTYLGGTADDRAQGIALDASGNAYVAGLTISTNFPTSAALQPASGGGWDGFVAKLADSAGHAPVLQRIGDQAVNRGEQLAFTATAIDSDGPLDTGPTIAYAIGRARAAIGGTAGRSGRISTPWRRFESRTWACSTMDPTASYRP